jgi:hypothetical protein
MTASKLQYYLSLVFVVCAAWSFEWSVAQVLCVGLSWAMGLGAILHALEERP